MSDLSKRILSINESQTIGMAKLGRELKEKGVDVVNLSLGEPDFHTPQHIKDAAIEAINNNFTYYPPVAGYADLREAISRKFKNDNGLDYPAENIMVSVGAKHSIMNVVLSLINPGDEVIIPVPYWVSYSSMVSFAEGIPVYIQTSVGDNFKPSIEQIEAAITPKTKALMFSSPCNPTGSVWSYDELKALADLLEKHPHVYVISDEIYEHINFVGKHVSIASFPNIFERTVTVNGVSKGFAMTGWRIGYIGAPKWITQACEKLQGQFTSGACTIAQRASIAALSTSLKPTLEMAEAFSRRRELIYTGFSEIPGIKCNLPDGAFYLFPEVKSFFGKSYNGKTISNALDLAMFLVSEANVITVTGEAFGSPDNLRISYAASENDITKATDRIKTALAKLK